LHVVQESTCTAFPQVRLRAAIGDQVEPTRANLSRLGHLIVTGPDATAVDRHAERLLARITIHIAPSPSPRPEPSPAAPAAKDDR
jgi:biotin carboxylase